jgi:hypothetical protein
MVDIVAGCVIAGFMGALLETWHNDMFWVVFSSYLFACGGGFLAGYRRGFCNE